MSTDHPIRGHYSELIVGGKSFHYTTDMEAMDTAESLPECVRWQVRLQHDRGLVDSEKYREGEKER